MSIKPEVGGKFVIRGTITNILDNIANRPIFQFTTDEGKTSSAFVDLMSEFSPRPYDPNVGDLVKYKNGSVQYKVVGIYDGNVYIKCITSNFIYETENNNNLELIA